MFMKVFQVSVRAWGLSWRRTFESVLARTQPASLPCCSRMSGPLAAKQKLKATYRYDECQVAHRSRIGLGKAELRQILPRSECCVLDGYRANIACAVKQLQHSRRPHHHIRVEV